MVIWLLLIFTYTGPNDVTFTAKAFPNQQTCEYFLKQDQIPQPGPQPIKQRYCFTVPVDWSLVPTK